MSLAKATPILSKEQENSIKKRLLENVYRVKDCWVWTGTVDQNNYGVLSISGHGKMYAHRVSYMIFKEHIPEGLIVRHTCDTSWCINPKHLILGTNIDNMSDRLEANMTAKVEKALNMSDIRCLGYSVTEIAEMFNCSPATVYDLTRELANTIEERLNLRDEG